MSIVVWMLSGITFPISRLLVVRLLAVMLAVSSASALGASNVVQYGYDATGNVKAITRQAAAGLAVTSFSPSSALIGASVVVYGTGFTQVASNNAVKFNGTTAAVSSATTTSLSVVVPTGATTGPVSVTVGANTVTSSAIFTVIPPDAPTIASFTPPSGASGTAVTVAGTNFNTVATTVALNGVAATATIASMTSLSFVVPGAVGSGRITATTSMGVGTSSTDFVVPPPGVIAADIATTIRLVDGAPSSSFSVPVQNKNALLLFDGVQDGYYSLQFTSLQSSPTSTTVSYKIYRPNNTLLASGSIGNWYAPTIHVPKLVTSGTYSVLISPGVATLNANVQLAMNPMITIDLTALAVATSALGQTSRIRFQATAGQRLGLGILGMSVTPTSGTTTNFRVYHPDGMQLNGGVATCSNANVSNPQGNCDGEFTLTQSGVHTVVAEIPLTQQVTFSAQLSTQVTGTLAVDTPQTVTTTRVGQDARLALSVSSGESLAIELAAIASQPANQPFYAYVYKPDGSYLTSVASSTSTFSGIVNLGTIATAGTYAVEVDANYGSYGSVQISAKAGPILTTTDAATPFATAVNSETPRFRFMGTAGQNLGIAIDGLTHTPATGAASYLTVYKPDGTQLTTQSCYTSSPGGRCKLTLANLATTGTYSVGIASPAGTRIAGNLTLSSDQTGILSPAVAVALSVARSGQNVRYTFSGATGDSNAIELANLSTTPASSTAIVQVYKPDGALLTGGSTITSQWGTVVSLPTLPATGTYSVLVDVTYGATWQARLTLKPSSAITIDGTMPTLATTYPAEAIRFTFVGALSQKVDLGAAGLTYLSANASNTTAYLYRPDGSQVASFAWSPASVGGAGDLGYVNLPVAGTYSLLILPGTNAVISGGAFAASTPAGGSFTIDASAQTIALTRPGQTARYSFSGTSGQLRRINWTNSAVSGGTVYVSVLRPDGVVLNYGSFVNGAAGGFDVATLPSTGTFTVLVDPPASATISVDLAVVTR